MEKNTQLQNNSVVGQEKIKTVESQANFEGNYSLLLFERVRNPFIQEQLVNLLYEEELDHAKRGERTIEFSEDGKIVMTSNNEIKYTYTPYTARSKKEILDDFFLRLTLVETETPITYDSGIEPHCDEREMMPILSDGYMEDVGASHVSPKQEVIIKSMVEAHEKGHVLRPYLFNSFFKSYFIRGFDISTATNLTKNSASLNTPDKNPEEVHQNYITYLFSAPEIAERMSQLKGYFGFKGREQFTKEHLTYARSHYIQDTHLNNGMTTFLNAITPQTEEIFLEIINNSGI